MQSLTGSLQGENRVFPVKFFHAGKNMFSLPGIPAMKTGFPCEKNFTGKTLFSLQGWVCSVVKFGGTFDKFYAPSSPEVGQKPT